MRGEARLSSATPLLCALLLTLALLPGGASAASSRARPRTRAAATTIGLLTTSQRDVLRRGRLRVRVLSRRSGLVRLFATASAAGTASVVVTRTVAVRVHARRSRVYVLRLSRAGRPGLGGCGSRALTVVAAPVRDAAARPGRATRVSRRLRIEKRSCRRTQPRAVSFSTPSDAGRCDFLDLAVCLQPWPNDYFTTRDRTTATGRRLSVDPSSTPRNKEGKPIDPTDLNRNDGFSPGSAIETKVPGLDVRAAFARSRVVPLTDMGQAFRPSQPVVVINTRTLARHLVWAELDANPKNPADVNLIIRPGRNFDEGTRYVVALRSLRDARGRTLPTTAAFRLYRDRVLTTNAAVESRRAHLEEIFATLARAGIDRDGLYRAWDFTTASERNLSERILAIRNDAFRQLGDSNLRDLRVQGRSPSFQVTKVEDFSPAQNANLARRVEGTVTVPCYLNLPGCPAGAQFAYTPGSTTGLPQRMPGNAVEARFTCIVPRVAAERGGARVSLYGHGLFGSRAEVNQGQLQRLANEHDFVFCATEWIGMACSDLPSPSTSYLQQVFGDALAGRRPNDPNCDLPNTATILNDLSRFPTLTDRVQQSLVNFMYLGRAMIHPQGFAANEAFRFGGRSILDTRRLFYDGNSQGGIIGGALIAVEPDLDRGVLGVPGMNYSTLLQRSTDFGNGEAPHPNPTDPGSAIPSYAYPLYQSYPNELERPLILALIQNEWDRSEGDGYALHMTDHPLPGTPAHHVLMHGGLGDHQVAQIAAETEARTIGARVRTPYVDRGRDRDRVPAYGLRPIPRFPFDGSALVLWDIGPRRTENGQVRGTDPPPAANTAPSADQEDPHEAPRNTVNGRVQKSAFLRIGGLVVDVCGRRPCYASFWHGP